MSDRGGSAEIWINLTVQLDCPAQASSAVRADAIA